MRLASSSIVVRGDSGGETRAAGRPPMFPTRADLDAGVAILLAGRAAEEVLLGGASTGAVEDLAVATRARADGHRAHGLGTTLLARRFLTGDDVAALVASSGARGHSPRIRGRDA